MIRCLFQLPLHDLVIRGHRYEHMNGNSCSMSLMPCEEGPGQDILLQHWG